jgi:dTDP-6-deoxy-L-talose 4-dehydrogenase (NAD+)
MKTLITGATGFIGRPLLSHTKKFNFYYLVNNQKLEDSYENQIVGNLEQNSTLERIYKESFDRVIHLAWQGLPERNAELNIKNLILSKQLIDVLISANKECEINITGSCFEYGELNRKVNENDMPLNVGEFGKTKLELLNYLNEKTQNYRWFRLFFVYGPNQHPKSLINFIQKSLSESKEIILDKPDVCNDYIYVDDVAQIIWKLVNTVDCKGIINVGTGKLTSNSEILNTILKLHGKSGLDDNYKSNIKGIGLAANIEKMTKFVSNNEFTDLEFGISRTINVSI